ncbi:MAG: hypothetical protein ACK4UO_03090 [Pseudolabrys sp.]
MRNGAQRAGAILAVAMAAFAAAGAQADNVRVAAIAGDADISGVAAVTYGPYSVSPPTPNDVTICHGFECKYRTQVGLTAGDRARLAQMLAAGKASPQAERRAVAAAGAWFDKRVAPAAGTVNHVARAGYTRMYDAKQYDCIDSSRNTTSLLLLLHQLNLLRHHRVDLPVSRGFFFDGWPPHTTAVLVELASGEKWAVDSWTVAYGHAPEIMALSVWKTLE